MGDYDLSPKYEIVPVTTDTSLVSERKRFLSVKNVNELSIAGLFNCKINNGFYF